MEDQNLNQQNQTTQIPLPNATVVLVMGILSIVGCCCSYGIIGVVFGIIGLVMAKSSTATYNANPGMYLESSLSNVNTGKICAIIGLIMSILSIVIVIVFIAIYGIAVLTNPELLMEQMQY